MVVLLAAMALVACGEQGGVQPVTSADEGSPGTASTPTDVEAPELFRVSEPGLWDGRPSLGGIWVAHPDVTDPERVRIVNRSNGQSVVGALFRRERDLPGPALQVSSDAAEALGMLAGAPAPLDVVALRRIDPPATEEASAAPEPAADAVAPAAPEEIATTSLSSNSVSSDLRNPFVQLGTFDVEAHATDSAARLSDKGLPVRLVQEPDRGARRLLLGPASSAAEQSALLDQAVAEGFADAYLVRR
ncbi:SPOR domain-containing protein [Rubellimicrobium rubrum]|uniref:SPOR domain-containing protein n=2 Tax=Rubellimicrobium rubrum TaxID=2585369 RepID=A0A5C4N077_9RHOB|nr:SPOR domain-containing protein [Rubellimicrobium rubrum]